MTRGPPLGIAVGAAEIPRFRGQQLLAVSAAVMNLLNVFHAQGYGAISGPNSYDPASRAPGLRSGAPSGLVTVGARAASPRERPARAAFVSDWGAGG
jgi:hypothetical protein